MADKIEVKVCVGSSCHIRGADKTLRALEAIIARENLAHLVVLKADLCLDKCLEAPNVAVNGDVHGGVTPDRVEAFFAEHILGRVRP